MLKLCRQHEVHVSLGTDAHYAGAVGVFDQAAEVLREVDFPLELVATLAGGIYGASGPEEAGMTGRSMKNTVSRQLLSIPFLMRAA